MLKLAIDGCKDSENITCIEFENVEIVHKKTTNWTKLCFYAMESKSEHTEPFCKIAFHMKYSKSSFKYSNFYLELRSSIKVSFHKLFFV